MEDYWPNKQSVGETPNEKSVDESPPEQSVDDLQSVGEASKYEKGHQCLITANQYKSYVKASTECRRKSRSERERMLLEKGRVELLQKYKRRRQKRQLRHDKKKKIRELQGHETARVASSLAVNQLKQANKEASVEAKEEKTAPVSFHAFSVDSPLQVRLEDG